MSSLPQPTVILTHESDLDGMVSGLLLQRLAGKLFNQTPRLEAWNYNGWKNREPAEACAWVCDLNFEPRLDRPNWVIVDHHAMSFTAKNATLIHDVTKSAGTLCYELCKQHGIESPALDRLVHLNNVADLYHTDDPEFDLASDYANLVKTYNFWSLHALIDGNLENLLDHSLLKVMQVKRDVEDPLGFEWSKRHIEEITPQVGFVPTVVGNNNRIIYRLLTDDTLPYQVLVTMLRKANSQVVISLRSRNGEALPIAERLNGGGHPNACGGTLPRSIKQIPEAIDYLKKLLDPHTEKPASNMNNLGDLLSAFDKR